jgi:CHAT domain-containing protein
MLPALLVLAALGSPQAPAGFERCEQLAAIQPEAEETAHCFDQAGTALHQPERARAGLAELLRRHPGSPWPDFYFVYREASPLDEMARIAAAFAARKDAMGEVAARVNLYRLLFNAGRIDAAGAQVDRAQAAAAASGDAVLIARGRVLRGSYLWNMGKDLEVAYQLLRQAKPALFPGGPYPAQRECLLALGDLALELGRYQEGLDTFRSLAGLAMAKQDRFSEANARYGMARAVLDQTGELPSAEGRQESARLAAQAIAPAAASGNETVLSSIHLMLGALAKGEAAREHFAACLAHAATARDQSFCLDGEARFLSALDPAAAQRAIDRSLAIAERAQDAWSLAFAWREQMRLFAASGKPFASSLAALDAIEAMRDRQTGSAGQAEAFSTWSEDYYWLSGRLLASALAPDLAVKDPDKLEQAFEVAERLRARTLADALESAHAVSAVRAAGAAARRQRPDFATLARVRQALAADEALLSFQVSSWEDERGDFAGGSWLLVATRERTRVYRLPPRGELRPAVGLFNGTFERRDGSEAAPAAALYRRLLAEPLRELPAGIRRLILVPDDALHRLPFAALRETPQAPPLAVRYALTQAPSATLWLAWKGRRPAAAPIPALALADPPLRDGERLGPLPYARQESAAVVRALGGGSVRRFGAAASEAYLKTAALRRFGVLHFATHAVTDEVDPDRSGVLLAPGGGAEDGLLQIREIVGLDLGGRVVVLSACSSNTGALLRGEGVMSLARAFFQGGAHTVVASLWRLRDDEAADFFARFYRHLGRGASVGAALHAAQAESIAGGTPAAAWAGIVALGDGGLVPLPGGRKESAGWGWIAGAALLLAVAFLAAAYLRRRVTAT